MTTNQNTTARRVLTLAAIAAVTPAAATLAHATLSINVDKTLIGSDINAADNPFAQPQDPALSGGGRDQTMQFGDFLRGGDKGDLLIGRLGTDVLLGRDGHDVMIGGPEHFNPQNRDRALGGAGNDVFIWKPGDGSDMFRGGQGIDTVVFGLIGENGADGEPDFSVSNDQQAGDVYINPDTGLPLVDVANSPGFCEVIDGWTTEDSGAELDLLEIDHLVRFFIRGLADSFEAGDQVADNGLRVSLHLKSVEYLVCTSRDGGETQAFDLTASPPIQVPLWELPPRVQAMLVID